MALSLRPATLADADACGRICYEGFRALNVRHGFEANFPSVAAATNRIRASIEHPHVYGVVCERDGTIVGFNFLSERDPIRAVGPIVIDPAVQARGIGRALMAAVLERASAARGVQLLQDSFNMQSLALYADLGFEVRDLFVVVAGTPSGTCDAACEVRRLEESDLAGCEALLEQVCGFPRTNELREAVGTGTPFVAVRDGRVVAYMAAPTGWLSNHGVAVTGTDARALVLEAARTTAKPVSFLMSPRDAALFRWCLSAGLRAVKPMTLMTIGEYRQPRGSYFPSVLY